MPSKNLDPTKRFFGSFRFRLAESWKSNVNVTSPALVNCTFVASLIWSMGEPQPVFIPSHQRYQRFDFMIPKTPRQRGLWVEVVSHIQEVLNTSPALMPKRKGQCFSVIPPHSPEVDPKDPGQSLRRASSFAPQRPLELCHQPLARSHRPWEAKAFKNPSHTNAQNKTTGKYIPSRGLTYPTWGKGKSSSKCHFWGIC